MWCKNSFKLLTGRHVRSWVIAIVSAFLIIGCKQPDSNTLTIFHAGSLALPLKAATDSFKRYHPNVTIKLEVAGSVESARKIVDLNRQCDLFFSSDIEVIKRLLIPKHADFYIPFATNSMVLAYTPESKFASTVDYLNWPSILLHPDVSFGRSNPNSDPCGYRTVFVFQLAEKYFGRISLADSLIAKKNQLIRPKEIDLIALLETSAIDYLFIYESVAKQYGFPYISLPDSINLGNPSLAHNYQLAQLFIKGKSPDDSILIVGEPIVYAFTIPRNAPNTQLAISFAKYFLSDSGGKRIVDKLGWLSPYPSCSSGYGAIPEVLTNNSHGIVDK